MKQWLYGLAMSQSMFCAIPFPWNVWDEKAQEKMLLCLPLVGLEIGFFWWLLGWLGRYLNLPALLVGFLLCAYPFLATGYIHLDGFMDVTDAVKSYRSLERRREILKDSHVGSFAVIGVVLLLLVQFALFSSMNGTADIRILIFIPAVSRCCSIWAVLRLPKMSTSQYVGQQGKDKGWILMVVFLVIFILCGFLLCGKYALALLGELIGFALPLRRAYRSLEGMNGDVSGYAITLSELTAAAVLVLL